MQYELRLILGPGLPALVACLGVYDADEPLSPGSEISDFPGHALLRVKRVDAASNPPIAFCFDPTR